MLRSSPGLAQPQSPAQQQQQQLSPSPKSAKKSNQRVNGNLQVGPLTAPITPIAQVVTYNSEQEENSCMSFGPTRPAGAHKSPNRPKWSPLVHTIAEASESFTGTVSPAKLFDDVEDSNACQSKPNVAPRQRTVEVEEEEEEEIIPTDVLLSEIQRLTTHEFGGPFKAASYPRVLEQPRLHY
ncbi:hypothetical protein BGX26_010495 [Mortierella sp. AD094]|nr:hypothetical protein BGX26_010495 [Mortierella sp. AD094]